MIKRFTLIKVLFTLSAAFATFSVFAQDIHYSQFYASPLTLNPALTGINDCRYRISAMYRNQWSSIPAPYTTPSISFDINSIAPKVIKVGVFSAGMLIYNDRSGDGHLNNLSILASGGYMIHPDAEKKHSLSIGLQLGYTQKTIDFTKLTFENQYDGLGNFNPAIPSFEPYKPKTGYMDVNTGVLWMYKPNDKLKIYAGGAAFNLTEPKETFLTTTNLNRLPMRLTFHGGADFDISDKAGLLPSLIYMSQAGAAETNLGMAFRYSLQGSFDAKLFFGAYYRINDAIIPMVAMDYKNFKVGLSYDVNASSLSTASGYKGGFEVSINYTGCISSIIDVQPIQWCPRF